MLFHEAYLGKRLQDLLTLAHNQMKMVYEKHGLVIPVEGSSTMQVLAPGKWMSLTEIAQALDQSHQLIAQRIGKLRNLSLVTQRSDPKDGRRSEYGLTPAGEEQWQLLDGLMATTSAVNRHLFDEIGCDLLSGIDSALAALARENYVERFEKVSPASNQKEPAK